MEKDVLFDMSPYDDSLPVKLLEEAFAERYHESQKVTEKIWDDVLKDAAPGTLAPKQGSDNIRLVVDAGDNFLDDYKAGAVKLVQEKGHIFAQIRSNGRYGKKLPLKEEHYLDGPDALSIQNAMYLQAIGERLGDVAKQIETIDTNVKEVLIGQQNDRLGLYYSGVAMYLEASRIEEQSFRNQVIGQSVKTLSDAIFQLTLSLKADIRYLADKQYNSDKKRAYDLLKDKMASIDRAFMAIHQSTIMKVGIYLKQGEIGAAIAVLQEYERFITGTIVRNASMLSQCDTRDSGKEDGVWKTRARLRLDMKDTIQKMDQVRILVLEEKGE